MNKVEELELCRRGPDDEDALGVVESACDLVKKAIHVIRVFMGFGGPLGVTMHVSMRRLEPRRIEAIEVDVEDARFVMIEPDGGVARRSHDWFMLRQRRRSRCSSSSPVSWAHGTAPRDPQGPIRRSGAAC